MTPRQKKFFWFLFLTGLIAIVFLCWPILTGLTEKGAGQTKTQPGTRAGVSTGSPAISKDEIQTVGQPKPADGNQPPLPAVLALLAMSAVLVWSIRQRWPKKTTAEATPPNQGKTDRQATDEKKGKPVAAPNKKGSALFALLVTLLVLAGIGGFVWLNWPIATDWWEAKQEQARKEAAMPKWETNWVLVGHSGENEERYLEGKASVLFDGDRIEVSFQGKRGGVGKLRGVFDPKQNAYTGEMWQPGCDATFTLTPNKEKDNLVGLWFSKPKYQQGSRLQLIRQ